MTQDHPNKQTALRNLPSRNARKKIETASLIEFEVDPPLPLRDPIVLGVTQSHLSEHTPPPLKNLSMGHLKRQTTLEYIAGYHGRTFTKPNCPVLNILCIKPAFIWNKCPTILAYIFCNIFCY